MTLFLWIAILFLTPILGHLVYQDWWFLRYPKSRTKGTVVDHERRTDYGSEYFMAMVEFHDENGTLHKITDTYGGGAKKPPVGSPLPVIYPMGMPGKARVQRPFIRLVVYSFVVASLTILILRLLDILQD